MTAHVSNTAHFCRCQGKNIRRSAETGTGKPSTVTAERGMRSPISQCCSTSPPPAGAFLRGRGFGCCRFGVWRSYALYSERNTRDQFIVVLRAFEVDLDFLPTDTEVFGNNVDELIAELLDSAAWETAPIVGQRHPQAILRHGARGLVVCTGGTKPAEFLQQFHDAFPLLSACLRWAYLPLNRRVSRLNRPFELSAGSSGTFSPSIRRAIFL